LKKGFLKTVLRQYKRSRKCKVIVVRN